MADSRADDLLKQGDALFGARTGLVSAWQTIAENFYPLRADFLGALPDGNANSDLFSSYPVLAHRELGNMFAAMLRPRSARWFSAHVNDETLDGGKDERGYLEFISDVMWRAMYDPEANFVRATKECDLDYAAFGQGVIQVRLDMSAMSLLYSTHHIRDCAWSENERGRIDVIHRRMSLSARQIEALFPGKASKAVQEALKTNPEQKFHCRHIVVPESISRFTGPSGRRYPFTSIYIECEERTVLEETGRYTLGYVVPRWQTVAGSQYARSPATEVALPDGLSLQVITRTLREAGEKHVDPPLLAKAGALRSDIELFAGGRTVVDDEYDDRMGDPLRPVVSTPGTMPIGIEIAQAIREDIRSGMFLDKLMLPSVDARDMTAFEVRRRIEEYVRAAAPLFEPVEEDYNAPLCNETFEVLKRAGAFGPADLVPETLRGSDIRFTFQSPLRDLSDSNKTQIFLQGLGVVGQAAQFDQAAPASIELDPAIKDALEALGWPAEWMADPKKIAAARAQLQRTANMQRGLAALQQGGAAGKDIAATAKGLDLGVVG